MYANNTLEAKRDKFERVLNEIILTFVHTKLDLYQKLNKKDVNNMLKRQRFDG